MTIALPIRDRKSDIFASLVALVCAALIGSAMAQLPLFAPKSQQKKASELIKKQDPPKVIPRVLEKATPDNVSIYISLSKQRAYLQRWRRDRRRFPDILRKARGDDSGRRLQDH